MLSKLTLSGLRFPHLDDRAYDPPYVSGLEFGHNTVLSKALLR